MVNIYIPITGSVSGIEKDSRPVIEYKKPNTTWYIMHNLDQINGVAMIDEYAVLLSCPQSVDDMKAMIDSIYE